MNRTRAWAHVFWHESLEASFVHRSVPDTLLLCVSLTELQIPVSVDSSKKPKYISQSSLFLETTSIVFVPCVCAHFLTSKKGPNSTLLYVLLPKSVAMRDFEIFLGKFTTLQRVNFAWRIDFDPTALRSLSCSLSLPVPVLTLPS